MSIKPNSVSDFRITKGTIRGIRVFSLDCASTCTKEECPLFNICTYEKEGLCTLEQKWIQAAFNPFVDLLNRVPSKFLAQIIGMQIMPLFRHLIILHKKQLAMTLDEVFIDTQKGLARMNPLFSEIRQTSSAIMSLMAKANILELADQAGLMDVLTKTPPRPDESTTDPGDDEAFNLTYGDPGHLDAIIGEF
jgi:hypothetical protein